MEMRFSKPTNCIHLAKKTIKLHGYIKREQKVLVYEVGERCLLYELNDVLQILISKLFQHLSIYLTVLCVFYEGF